MKVSAVFVGLVGSAAAFAPTAQRSTVSSTAVSATDLKTMVGATMPWKGFDPLGLASLGSESTYAWFRASELKHARCAMLATTGYLVQAAGVHFPGMLSHDVSFESLSTMKPLDAWAAMPSLGQQQIIGR
jgi:Chlorophyll A-B binding protein